jgi:hypothetical protein
MRRTRTLACGAGAALLVILQASVGPAWAKVGPPVKIRMPGNSPQAEAKKVYAGVFEVDVARSGTLADFKLEGEGWTILSFDTPADPGLAQVGTLRIPFRAVPQDADRPIRFSFTWDGRRVSKAYEVGPRYFGRAGKARAVQSTGVRLEDAFTVPIPKGADQGQAAPSDGAISLRFTGRFVYTRPDGRTVGADHILVEVMDEDSDWDATIWSDYTDENGYFDSGVFTWEDCDLLGCEEEPDIYVQFECDTPVGQVQDPGVMEEDYHWDTMDNVHEDFTGSEIHFGTIQPSDSGEMPAVHIWNSMVRAHRYIGDVTGIDVDHVDVQWPETGDTSCYIEFFDEIYITAEDQWSEGTFTHEYGHHFMANHSINTEADYCNDYCDYGQGVPNCYDTEKDDCSHCAWCEETDHDAWNEGVPNWLGYVIPSFYPLYYEFDDCTPYTALDPLGFESINDCCQDGQWHDPWRTEGFVTALLRDITDQRDDAHDPRDNDDEAWSDTTDCMALGPAEIFTVVTEDQPTTPAEFISMFRSRYPQHTAALWKTARNVHPDYVAGFPADTAPPGPVTVLDSPTHPLGVGGALPCITVEFDQPTDDVTGSAGFSVEWTTDPGGAVPNTTIDWAGSCVSRFTSPPKDFGGEYYVSIRAVDHEDHWGPTETFGPFAINGDCNDNGIMDLCDITCDASSFSGNPLLQCYITADFCDVPGCGTATDCNGNLVPDSCDLVSGTSKDCDQNGIPDECYVPWATLIQWADGNGSWHNPNNWYKRTECPEPPPPPTCGSPFPAHCPALPEFGDNVCINSADDDITVTYTNDATQVGVLGCYENLSIAGGSSPSPYLVLDAPDDSPSWVSGDLSLSGNNTTLGVWDRLDIGGLFEWIAGSQLAGPGVTYANGGVYTTDLAYPSLVYLNGHHLILDGHSTSVGSGRVEFLGASVFEIRPGSSYEHQGGTYFLNGGADDQFVNQGTLIKSVNSGTSMINAVTSNTGLIHVKAGTLSFRQQYSSSGGDFLGDPGTAFQFVNGGFTFHAGSSVVADNILFTDGAAGWNTVRGSWNVTTSTTISAGQQVTFAEEANVISYGSSFYIPRGTVNFNTVIGGTIHFDTLSIGPGATGDGIANFNSGDPVQVTNLIIGPGTIQGVSDITLNGLTTWNAGGDFGGTGTVNANGDVLINPNGDQKTLNNCTFNNAATATFLGGFGRSSAVVNNLATGVMDIQADVGVLSGYAQPLNNAGTIVKSAGIGTSTIQATMNNTGTVEVRTGVLKFYAGYGGSYVQTAGQTVLNGGDVLMSGPASLQINGGLLSGAGTVTGNVINAAGSVEPGLPVGALVVVGNYTQGADGALVIEIGGPPAQCDLFDRLEVSGTMSLQGVLHVQLLDGCQPRAGDAFDVLDWGNLAGTFIAVDLPALTAALSWDTSNLYVTGVLSVGPVVPADFDRDGDVDSADMDLFESCASGPGISRPAGCEAKDFDGDNDVDQSDFAVFQRCFSGPDVPADPNCAN